MLSIRWQCFSIIRSTEQERSLVVEVVGLWNEVLCFLAEEKLVGWMQLLITALLEW